MRTPNGPRSNKGGKAVQKVTALVLMLIGSICCAPFIYDIMYMPHSSMFTLWDIATVALLVVGGPMFMYGLSSLFAHKHGHYSTTDIELGRIRHSIEQDSWKGK